MKDWNPDADYQADVPGEEGASPLPLGHTRPVVVDESWTLLVALERAWAEGYTAGHSRAMRLMSDEPNVAHAVNPYTAPFVHSGHKPVQHRDRKRPWCNECGCAADGELIGRPKSDGDRKVCPQDPQHYLDSHGPGGAWYGVGHGGQPSPWSPRG